MVHLKWSLKGSTEKSVRLNGVLLGQTREGVFSRSGHRRKNVLLKQAAERTRDEELLTNGLPYIA